eukprot:scaffold57908_cov22-Tisochrysis_lutea.AAC.4
MQAKDKLDARTSKCLPTLLSLVCTHLLAHEIIDIYLGHTHTTITHFNDSSPSLTLMRVSKAAQVSSMTEILAFMESAGSPSCAGVKALSKKGVGGRECPTACEQGGGERRMHCLRPGNLAARTAPLSCPAVCPRAWQWSPPTWTWLLETSQIWLLNRISKPTGKKGSTVPRCCLMPVSGTANGT